MVVTKAIVHAWKMVHGDDHAAVARPVKKQEPYYPHRPESYLPMHVETRRKVRLEYKASWKKSGRKKTRKS